MCFQDYTDDQSLLLLVFEAASVYFNYTGAAQCLNIQDEDDIGADMWAYQACTEMVSTNQKTASSHVITQLTSHWSR